MWEAVFLRERGGPVRRLLRVWDMQWTCDELAAQAGGRLLRRSDRPISGAFIDSRAPVPGGLFVPIVAARDGHAFVPQAIAGGAAAVLVARGHAPVPGDVSVVEVDDTSLALARLARARRERFSGPVIGITGSNGKTTTRAMIEAVVGQGFAPVLATQGNLNNHLGVPLTLLGQPHAPEAMIVEMGMSAPGENDRLGAIVQPTVHVITSIALEHLEFMKSIEAIASAEAEPLAHMREGAVVVVPSDEPLLDPHLAEYPGLLRASAGPDADADVRVVSVTQGERTQVELQVRGGHVLTLRLQLFGSHNARNAAAAVAVGLHLGIAESRMVEALEAVEPVGDRGRVHRIGPHLLIADCYNANPGSMEVALTSLAALRSERPGRLCAVLGDMLELGPTSKALHRGVGERCVALGLDAVATVGGDAEAIAEATRSGGLATLCRTERGDADIEAVARWVRDMLPGDEPGAVLVKGSRGVRLERVVERLLQSRRASAARD